MSDSILVIGSTGKTGKRVYSRLEKKGLDIRPASRTSVIPFDWYDELTWPEALKGISKAYLTFQPDLAVPASEEIIFRFAKAAKNARLSKLVLLSGRGEEQAIACENLVKDSGMDWTIIRSSFFMQNFSEGLWANDISAKEFIIPAVRAKEPFVDADDIADVVVEALTDYIHNGKVYEMTGGELLSFEEAIEKLSAALHSEIKLFQIPIKEYKDILRTNQVPDDIISLISYLFTEVLDGRNESIVHDIELVLNRKPGSFDDFIQNAIREGCWKSQ